MQQSAAPFPWRRGSVALLVTLFLLIIAIPRAVKPVSDRSTSPPTTHFEFGLLPALGVIALCVPLVCILFLGRSWPSFETVGWILLAVIFVGAFFH